MGGWVGGTYHTAADTELKRVSTTVLLLLDLVDLVRGWVGGWVGGWFD